MTPIQKSRTSDPNVYLSTIDGGKKMSAFRKKRIIVAQGEVCDSIFLNPTVRVRLTVVPREEGTH